MHLYVTRSKSKYGAIGLLLVCGALAIPCISYGQTRGYGFSVVDSLGYEETVNADDVKKSPTLSVQQAVKGRSPGLYVQELTAEPGTTQYMFLRGTSVPLLTKTSAMDAQPVVYVNGIPFIGDRSFSYTVKNNDVNPIGPANNPLASLDISNIETIEVVKDPVELAKLGPIAANGAIWITTKNGYYGGHHAHVDAQLSVVTPKKNVTMTNGWDELAFRRSFYPSLSDSQFANTLPAWLQDTTDPYFFGSPDWASDYYSSALQYNVNASLGGGNRVANYLVTVGSTTNAAGTDNAGYDKYNVEFYLNINPFKGVGFNAMIRYAYADRIRNTSMRDRYAEIEYMPELVTPLVPTREAYGLYKSYADNTIDENDSKSLNGILAFHYKWNGLHTDVYMKADYESLHRRAFWPSTMMSGVNFVSVYTGYNRRFMGEASVGYDWKISDKHKLNIAWKGIIQEDLWHYNYAKGIDGDDDKKPTTNGGNYTQFRYLDEETLHTFQSAVTLGYGWNDILNLNAVLRSDAASNVHQNHRWLFTPAFGATLKLKNVLLKDVAWLNALNLKGGWSRVGKLLSSDRFALGSIYTSESLSWAGVPVISSYNGLPSITRPYNFGWVDFGSEWPYSDKLEVGLKAELLNHRFSVGVTYYDNKDKNQFLPLPVNREFGYEYAYKQGMDITNRGVELNLGVTPVSDKKGWTWTIDMNLAYNKNVLDRLPDGLTETVINGRKLKVGESADRFYLLENRGKYTADSQIPVKNGSKLSVGGVPVNVNDPIWVDQNGDNKISDDDKVMTGNALPKLYGGLYTTIKFKRFDLTLDFYGAFGHKALNYRTYQVYNFATLDYSTGLDAIREINFWQTGTVPNDLPRYDVTSGISPYRYDQNLYLEDASYLKLRNVTLGYTLPLKKTSVYMYVTGSNLLTFSDFSGDDPEAIDSDGIYRGYGMALPRTVTIGFKCNF